MSKQSIKTVKKFRHDGYAKHIGEALDEVVAMAERMEEMENALKVIHTWAGVDGALVPEHVRKLTTKALRY